MPYIVKEYRPFYNAIVNTILSKIHLAEYEWLGWKVEASCLVNKLKSLDWMAQDGQLNYFITKLMIDADFLGRVAISGLEADIIEDFIIKVLKEVYPRKYAHYNRAVGTLTCCGKEFTRIFGERGVGIREFLEYLADSFYQFIVGPYESEKRKLNGPVT